MARHAAKFCVRWQPTVILREWCLPRAVLETRTSHFKLVSRVHLSWSRCEIVPIRKRHQLSRTRAGVSWTLEIPLNKYTEELLDAIYRFIVDVSSVHALHASAVSTELRTRFAELRQVTSQFRVGSCEVFGRD